MSQSQLGRLLSCACLSLMFFIHSRYTLRCLNLSLELPWHWNNQPTITAPFVYHVSITYVVKEFKNVLNICRKFKYHCFINFMKWNSFLEWYTFDFLIALRHIWMRRLDFFHDFWLMEALLYFDKTQNVNLNVILLTSTTQTN